MFLGGSSSLERTEPFFPRSKDLAPALVTLSKNAGDAEEEKPRVNHRRRFLRKYL